MTSDPWPQQDCHRGSIWPGVIEELTKDAQTHCVHGCPRYFALKACIQEIRGYEQRNDAAGYPRYGSEAPQ